MRGQHCLCPIARSDVGKERKSLFDWSLFCQGELNLSDSHLPVIARPLQAGDQLCFIGIRECLEDIAGLEICFFEGSQLEGMTFFEMRLVSKLFSISFLKRKKKKKNCRNPISLSLP